MKEISLDKQKKIMLEILDEFHKLCVKNNIKYSLIGGSLIGAVRNNGIIPWDDDIDLILMPEEYDKLINVLKSGKFKYRVVNFENTDNYYNPGMKIVDDDTRIVEQGVPKSYGVFIDVFRYNYIPNNVFFRYLYLFKYKFMINVIHGFFKDSRNDGIIRKLRNLYSLSKNPRKYIRKFDSFMCKYNNKKTNYLIANSTMYSLEKEIQKAENMSDYIVVKFDNINSMITKQYDDLLTNIFGDYMTPPPVEQRVGKHDIIAYYKEK